MILLRSIARLPIGAEAIAMQLDSGLNGRFADGQNLRFSATEEILRCDRGVMQASDGNVTRKGFTKEIILALFSSQTGVQWRDDKTQSAQLLNVECPDCSAISGKLFVDFCLTARKTNS
jgi:hypothetical protein